MQFIELIAHGTSTYLEPSHVVAIEPDGDGGTVIHLSGGTVARTLMTADQVVKAIDRATSGVLEAGARITFNADIDQD